MPTSLLDPTRPFWVPDSIGKVQFVVVNDDAKQLPASVAAMIGSSPERAGLRIAGGCANMSPDDKVKMLDWFVEGLGGFSGLVSSGATRQLDESGLLDPMVTDVPAALLLAYPDQVVTVSTAPRTGDMGIVEDSRLVLSDGQLPNPGVHMIVIVQAADGSYLEWDGDLPIYFNHFEMLRRTLQWIFGCVIWNGGGVTRTEAVTAANYGWPVFLAKGSGRAADELSENPHPNMVVVDCKSSDSLADAVGRHGLWLG